MERLGQVLSEWLGTHFEWKEDDREIAAFSLTLLISFLFTLMILLVLSSLVGALAEAAIMVASSGLLRSFAGGAHFSTGWRCGVVSALMATGAAWLANRFGPDVAVSLTSMSSWVTAALCLLVASTMLRYAPVDVPEKPITSIGRRRRLRIGAVMIAIAWGAVWTVWLGSADTSAASAAAIYGYWLASVIGVVWETFSILPPGSRFVKWSDRQISQVTFFSERREAL